jgi:hypothetical protein
MNGESDPFLLSWASRIRERLMFLDAVLGWEWLEAARLWKMMPSGLVRTCSIFPFKLQGWKQPLGTMIGIGHAQ